MEIDSLATLSGSSEVERKIYLMTVSFRDKLC